MQTFVDNVSRFLSPYDLNPLDINPLKDLISRSVDFDAVRAFADLRLFVSATNVHTGAVRGLPANKPVPAYLVEVAGADLLVDL